MKWKHITDEATPRGLSIYMERHHFNEWRARVGDFVVRGPATRKGGKSGRALVPRITLKQIEDALDEEPGSPSLRELKVPRRPRATGKRRDDTGH